MIYNFACFFARVIANQKVKSILNNFEKVKKWVSNVFENGIGIGKTSTELHKKQSLS